ncbi:UNVERIFIED_CONTAM: hypothetical protein K2H54_054482 [Gekko kuhli]
MERKRKVPSQICGVKSLIKHSLVLRLTKGGSREQPHGEMNKVAKNGARRLSRKSNRDNRILKTEPAKQKRQNMEVKHHEYKELRHLSGIIKKKVCQKTKQKIGNVYYVAEQLLLFVYCTK